jgi:hypothetical protein
MFRTFASMSRNNFMEPITGQRGVFAKETLQ